VKGASMKKQISWILGLGLLFLGCFLSCVSSEKKLIQNSISALDKAVIDASESIIAKLPQNSTVALFNNSVDETDLTNHVIEEISSYLTDKSSLIVIERERFETIEKEQNWQMDTGYVSDEEQVSIAHRLGAQYVVSSYISGTGSLQRLRITTWNVASGQIIVTSVFPTNEMGVQLVKAVEEANPQIPQSNYITIKEDGITIDYRMMTTEYIAADISFIENILGCDVYIDGTQYYFTVALYNSRNNYEVTYYSRFNNVSGNMVESFDSDFASNIISYLMNEGIDRRNTNFISRIIMRIVNREFIKI
jgi:PBP1b-binding outer membrane lipoprotein LpoB